MSLSWMECAQYLLSGSLYHKHSSLNAAGGGFAQMLFGLFEGGQQKFWHAFIWSSPTLAGHSWGGSPGLSGRSISLSLGTSAVWKSPSQAWKQAAHSGSCFMRLFEQRLQPSFSDKGDKVFCVCVWQKQRHTKTGLQQGRFRQAGAGSGGGGMFCRGAKIRPNVPGFFNNTEGPVPNWEQSSLFYVANL